MVAGCRQQIIREITMTSTDRRTIAGSSKLEVIRRRPQMSEGHLIIGAIKSQKIAGVHSSQMIAAIREIAGGLKE